MANVRLKQTNLTIDTARKSMMDPSIPIKEAAEKAGVTRHGILHARVLLEYGTAQELADVIAGAMGLSNAYKAAKERMGPEDREKLRTRHAPTSAEAREKYSGEAAIWAKLGPALRGLSQLPNPHDVIKIVTSHSARETTVNQNLTAAAKWMEEFVHAWNSHKSGGRVAEGSVDPRMGNATSGVQHSKSAA